MARESERAARLAEAGECPRSAISRYYYAAYQSATALLLYRRLTPPAEREAWSHVDTPLLVSDDLSKIIPKRQVRTELMRRSRELYKMRIVADYTTDPISETRLREISRDARFVVSAALKILPKGTLE